ncbi:MAG: hypothetical protein K6C08_01040 [Oscillospiraceae bacterium]|nr:hypothetical protein [Oscillospiraceae bacterium]
MNTSSIEKLDRDDWKNRALVYSEPVVVVSSATLLACMAMNITMLSVRMPGWFSTVMQILLTLAAMVRIVAQARKKLLWGSVLAALVYYLSWDFYYFQLIALMTVACVGIPYRKVLKAYLIGVGAAVVGTILLALAGGVTNLVYMKDGYLRSSMGICFPTDFATIVLFLLLTLWVWWEELPDEAAILIPAFSTWVAWYLARSYTSSLCGLVFLGAVLYRIFERRVIEQKNRLLWLKKAVNVLVVVMFPALMLLMFVLMAGYARGASFAYVANNLMSNRVKLSLEAYRENGVSLFGHSFRQAGAGGSTYATLNYEFVDSSYPRILLFYGVVILLLVCVLWVCLSIRAVRADRRRLAFVLAIIAFHSLSEHHFIEPYYNVFLILPFASMELGIIKKEENRKKAAVRWGVGVAGSVLVILLLPMMLSYFRIVVSESASQGRMLTLVILAAAAVMMLILECAYVALALAAHEKLKTTTVTAAACACLVLVSLSGWSVRVTASAAVKREALIESDRPELQTVLNAKSGELFVDRLGELYRRAMDGVSRSVFDGEDLARIPNATVVVDRKMDSPIFIGSGFLYTPISDTHAVYTKDDQVISALKEEGRQLTAFCTAENTFDLQDAARINLLAVNADGSVTLGGDSHSLIFGEGSSPLEYHKEKVVNLYAGKYTANYQLKIDPIPYEKDYPVCRIVIDAYAGEKNLRSLTVYRSWFDENGDLDAKVSFTSESNPVVIFQCLMEEGQTAVLKGITWQRTPDYDKRPVYNEDHDKIRDEYYDRTGTPVMNREGFASCAYHYWDKRTVDEIRYFDLEGNPVNMKNGYATVSRTFNIKRQKIREEYLNVEGKPAVHADGYALREWEYDVNGDAAVLRFCDTDGNLVMTAYGYAEVHREYDKKHRVIAEVYFGTDGKPIRMPGGYFGIRKVYEDEIDKIPMEMIYTDENGKTLVTDSGFSVVKLAYDGATNIREEQFCDAEKNPVLRTEGYASEKRIFDLAGNVWIYQFCDLEDKPVMTEYGYAEVRRTYDENGFVTSESYYNADGEQIELPEGFARIKCENDAVGNVVFQRFYALDGRLIHETDSDFWFAVEEKKEPDRPETI